MRLPGVEPGSIAWKAIILTVGLQTRVVAEESSLYYLYVLCFLFSWCNLVWSLFGTWPPMEMKLSRGPWMRRQFTTLFSPFLTIHPSSFSSIPSMSHPFPSINSPALTHSRSPHSFSNGRSLSFSAAATLESPLPPTLSGIIGIPFSVNT